MNTFIDCKSLYFPIGGRSFSAERPQKIIATIKNIVKTINRYKIDDESAIVYLFQHKIQLPKHKITETEIKIISELIKNPSVSNREIAKRYNLSEVWISKEKKKLIKKRVLVPMIAVDYSFFGLIHKLVLFSTFPRNCELLLSLLLKNPYVFQITKVFDITSRNTLCQYLVSLLIPSKYQKQFTSWISDFYHYKIVQDVSLLNIREFNHSLNLSLYKKGKWYFDGFKDAFLFFQFLRKYNELIQVPDFSFTLKCTRAHTEHNFSFERLVLLGELLKNPFQNPSNLKKALYAKNIKISKTQISTLRDEIFRHNPLYFKVRHHDLNGRIFLFLWEPFIRTEDLTFLRKYLMNYPQSDIYMGSEGIYSIMEFPIWFYKDVKFSLKELQEKYDTLFLFDACLSVLKRPFSDLVSLWDTTRNYWYFEQSILPEPRKK